MILTGKKIAEEVKKGRITIMPFDFAMVNPNSYNYRLGNILYQIDDAVLSPTEETKYKKITITEEGFTLQPNKLYLGSTLEEIGSNTYAMTLIGRSSIGRLGLFLQVSAPLGHIGTKHCWTLELKVVQPLKIYPNMKIGQLSFWKVDGETRSNYLSNYWNMSTPGISKFFEEMHSDTDG